MVSSGLPGHGALLRQRLERAIQDGPPSDRFLWPLDLAIADGFNSYGYVMGLREKRFHGIVSWMARKVNPSFYALATAGFELADNYLLLHAKKGLCYRDISFGNVFFDPDSGEIRICDNDNVNIDGQPGEIGGTPSFMAPEIVRGNAPPSTATDRFSLAVLLFYLLMVHHPLEGKKEADIRSLDEPARRKLYGTEPVFIFDPVNDSNRPVPGYQDNPLAYWPIYPQFLRDLFVRSFTDGLRDPINGRVTESEWRSALVRLRDSLLNCPHCRAENFYDGEALKASGGKPSGCWSCKRDIPLPFRMRIGKNVLILGPRVKLFPHHVNPNSMYDFSAPIAEVTVHPTQPDVLGLKNLTGNKWTYQGPDRTIKEVTQGMSCRLAAGSVINFGSASAEVRR